MKRNPGNYSLELKNWVSICLFTNYSYLGTTLSFGFFMVKQGTRLPRGLKEVTPVQFLTQNPALGAITSSHCWSLSSSSAALHLLGAPPLFLPVLLFYKPWPGCLQVCRDYVLRNPLLYCALPSSCSYVSLMSPFHWLLVMLLTPKCGCFPNFFFQG